MVRQDLEPSLYARQAIWKYWSTEEDVLEKEFYTALQPVVAKVIRERVATARMQRLWVGREMELAVGHYNMRARLVSLDPVLANSFDTSTGFIAQYQERAKDERQNISTFLAEVIRYPNEELGNLYDSLVGIDDYKNEMLRKLQLLLNPEYVERWFQAYYAAGVSGKLTQTMQSRYPLLILEGEVGAGKTALARSIGHKLSSQLSAPIALFVVNAQVRGSGHVGELTQNISRAFDEAERCQEQEQIPVMLLIDEADALAQVRGSQQTHHEDDAGVNTLIQRIDRLRGRPMAVIFATNLFHSLDAAILRRAIATFHFERPYADERMALFQKLLQPLGLTQNEYDWLAWQTNPTLLPDLNDKLHRYTYSDISQRIVPDAVERALYKGAKLAFEDLRSACSKIRPTPDPRCFYREPMPQNFDDYFFELESEEAPGVSNTVPLADNLTSTQIDYKFPQVHPPA